MYQAIMAHTYTHSYRIFSQYHPFIMPPNFTPLSLILQELTFTMNLTDPPRTVLTVCSYGFCDLVNFVKGTLTACWPARFPGEFRSSLF